MSPVAYMEGLASTVTIEIAFMTHCAAEEVYMMMVAVSIARLDFERRSR